MFHMMLLLSFSWLAARMISNVGSTHHLLKDFLLVLAPPTQQERESTSY
jgi:hypothetical protein